jgi:energy-coupling factor transporter ATP-binding protein EcfA2
MRNFMSSQSQPTLLVVTGASGSGKTTLVRGVEAIGISGVGCYYFDSIGVPSIEEMQRLFGSPENWQTAMIDHWITLLLSNKGSVQVAVLDGQVRPSVVQLAFDRLGARLTQIVLIDCSTADRHARLRGDRSQPELANAEMDCWAAYLRGQADALALPIINTTQQSCEDAIASLVDRIHGLR